MLKPDDPNDVHPVCKKCDGERKNKPIEGMTIMWGLKKDGDEWSGGQILDPSKGKIYKVTIKLIDGGNKLDVHGFIGFSLIGRSRGMAARGVSLRQRHAGMGACRARLPRRRGQGSLPQRPCHNPGS